MILLRKYSPFSPSSSSSLFLYAVSAQPVRANSTIAVRVAVSAWKGRGRCFPFGCSPGTPQGRNSLCPVLNLNVSTRLRLPSVYVLHGSGLSVHLVLMVAASLGIFAYFPPTCMSFALHAQQTHARSFSLGRDHRGDLHPR